MLCEKCNKNRATVRYSEVINGKVSILSLCQECMDAQQKSDATGFRLAAPSPMRRIVVPPGVGASAKKKTCPSCGVALHEVSASCVVGCGKCYEAFAGELDVLLPELHGAARHQGKALHIDDARERVRAELQTKRALLRSALKVENYEEAAALRDIIRSLQEELNAPVSK